jgi:large subunit ribosomal protein L23
MRKTPYKIVFNRIMTEKSKVLESLQHSTTNKCTRKCELPKYVFNVDCEANKIEIATAIEIIYPNVKVTKVNTIQVKPKKKRVKGRIGRTKKFKKAVITLSKGDVIEDQV